MQQEKERLELENKKKQEELAAKADREQKLKKERQIKEAERLKRQEEKRLKEEDRLRKEEEKKKKRLREEKARLAEKERKRKEEQLKKDKQEMKKAATTAATTVIMTATTNASAAAAASVVEENNIPITTSPALATDKRIMDTPHHILTDSKTSITPIGQRRTSLAGPIGSPVRSRSIHQTNQYVANDSETQYSFFSNFLFGQTPTTTARGIVY